MPKPKRKKAKPLTQDEIWDDSALINSWNEALEEYKLYHSIAARGENVHEVLRATAGDEIDPGQGVGDVTPAERATANHNGNVEQEESDEGGMNEIGNEFVSQGSKMIGPRQPQTSPETRPEAAHKLPDSFSPDQVKSTATMPEAIMSSSQDEGLKNLMMAWYYAGYYTGLYEGQQKAAESTS